MIARGDIITDLTEVVMTMAVAVETIMAIHLPQIGISRLLDTMNGIEGMDPGTMMIIGALHSSSIALILATTCEVSSLCDISSLFWVSTF